MRESILEVLETGSTLTYEEILMHIVVSAVLGCVIFLSYYLSHLGTIYSKKFNVSLVAMTVLTATVMTVIGDNVALSLGMVGALSIVRFRTAIKDSRDTIYIFWTIIVGICCGVGDYTVAVTGTAVVFLVLLVFGHVKNDSRILLVIRAERLIERNIEASVFSYFNRKAILKVKNTTPTTVEMIFELPKNANKIMNSREKGITSIIYDLGEVEYVNIVMQSDDISG